MTLALTLLPVIGFAASGEKPVERTYVTAPDAPKSQSWEEADQKSAGCVSCHTATDRKTMHQNPGVVLGCADCHGGDASVMAPAGAAKHHDKGHHDDHAKAHNDHGKDHGDDHGDHYGRDYESDPEYMAALKQAHVLPRYPKTWHWPASANPKGSYTLLNKESPEYTRFVNPSDYRIAREACGACHLRIIQAAERSLMATGAMLWGGAAYNNGILPFKNYILGEAYTRDGKPAALIGPQLEPREGETEEEFQARLDGRGIRSQLLPMPSWETTVPVDVFRVFERGGRNILNLFPEIGNPQSLGASQIIQRLEEPGRPDIRQSNRGPATGLRIAVPIINVHKTRLNDPFMWFMGTNDQPGDFRHSGCAGCHVVYANDRDPRHSAGYAQYGHWGKTLTKDPTIPADEPGHPLKHEFTRAIPTSQCMICHMHQPNIFLNSFLGYTMWDYESDAPLMWPEEQQYPTHKEMHDTLVRNPEEAVIRGKWADVDFLSKVWTDINPRAQNTQFADYHGHGWNFRAIFKKDRKGNLLDADGNVVSPDDPDKFKKAVHMSSIHLDVGMHCIDCHFGNDGHGNGHLQGEVANAVEIGCRDCHGTPDAYPNLRTSGPMAPPGGFDLSNLRVQDGRLRFEWVKGKLYQRSALWPELEWEMSLVKDAINPSHRNYNAKAARAKTLAKLDVGYDDMAWGPGVRPEDRAHDVDEMMCFTCHLSWTTSCGGCHLPIQANWKTERHKYEGGETRNFATYNPQVVRDQMFQLGRHQTSKGNKIAPIRSTSALMLSSTNINREKIYIQQPPIAASGYSSQAFAPHFPHTVRKTETKTCSDCHVDNTGDNNAIMAQTLLHGTNFVNFVGYNAWVGRDNGIEAVRVTEWDEPQAVIGSFLHRYAYPDWYNEHQERGRALYESYDHRGGKSGCIQQRGEYVYSAEGDKGMQVYDIASIANKGISQRIIRGPFGDQAKGAHIPSANATCVALPTNQPIHPERNKGEYMRLVNQEQPFHPIYNYAFITDAVEGLIVTDVNTFADFEPRNNAIQRALTWNEGGVLDGATHVTIGGHYFYIATPKGLVVLNMDDPLKPEVLATLPLNNMRASALQFRYLTALDDDGFKIVDVTNPRAPRLVPDAMVPLKDARRVYLARTFAYVAAGEEGLAIVDIEKPEQPKLYEMFTADGKITDASDVVVGTTNASLIGYVADGVNGLKVVQLTSPESQPRFYGFSPDPKPELIAWYQTKYPARSLSKGLDRDRGVDETGGQIAVFGRLGSRPFTREEQEMLYLRKDGSLYTVDDNVLMNDLIRRTPRAARNKDRDQRASLR